MVAEPVAPHFRTGDLKAAGFQSLSFLLFAGLISLVASTGCSSIPSTQARTSMSSRSSVVGTATKRGVGTGSTSSGHGASGSGSSGSSASGSGSAGSGSAGSGSTGSSSSGSGATGSGSSG